MIKKIIWIVCYCILPITIANAEDKGVKGVLKDKESGENLSYITIHVQELIEDKPGHRHRSEHNHQESAISNEKGEFEITSLCDGIYELKVSSLGYLPVEKVIEIKNGRSAFVNVGMEKRIFQTDEIVISANRNEVSRKLAPVVVNVLNAKTFETVNSVDLSQGLNYQSGLRVENNCQNCGFPQVRINGLDGPYSQILIDSRPVLSALSGVYGLEQIPMNMIDRVEIVRGGGSALFGSNAVAGTINIITKDPVRNSFQAGTSFHLLGGKALQSQVNANAALVTKDNKAGISLYQSFRDRNYLDVDGDGYSEIGKIDARSFGLRGYIRPTLMSRLSLEYHTSQEFRRGGNLFDRPPHETNITEQTDHNINGGGVTYDLFLDEYKHKISLYTSLQHIARESYYGVGMDPNAYGTTRDFTWVAGGLYVINFSKLLVSSATLTTGIEYQSNRLHDKMIGYSRDLKQEVRIGSVFVQNEWKGDLLSLLAGVRADKHNLIDHLILSPRVNLLYKPNDHVQARLTFSTGFRAPQAYDEDLHVAAVGGEGMVIRLAPNLKEERSLSYSGSVDLYKNWDNWQTNLLAELFYTDLRHVFVLEKIGEEDGHQVQERRNGKGARVFGINLDGKVAYANKAQLQLGFTVQKSRYKEFYAWSEKADPVKEMLRTPALYGYMTFTYNPWTPFQIAFSGTYTGRMYVPHFAGYIENDRLEHTSEFLDMNIKLSYDFKIYKTLILQLNGGVQNIFDSRQHDYDRGENRDSKYFYGPIQSRSYFLGLKIMNL